LNSGYLGQPDPHIIKRILQLLLNETIEHAVEKITQIQLEYAISITDILENITDHVLSLKFHDENISAALIERLSEIQKRVKNGCSESLQLNALVAAFVLARDKIFN
jgi:DNA polymerase III delta prime subunit